jgi:aldehyde:ferredoxin oxidoreductase
VLFGTGPLTVTLFPGTSRTDVMTKSPVTNLIGNTSFGGNFAAELKYAGYDHTVIKGKAEKPVYIKIDNEEVEIKDARSESSLPQANIE